MKLMNLFYIFPYLYDKYCYGGMENVSFYEYVANNGFEYFD